MKAETEKVCETLATFAKTKISSEGFVTSEKSVECIGTLRYHTLLTGDRGGWEEGWGIAAATPRPVQRHVSSLLSALPSIRPPIQRAAPAPQGPYGRRVMTDVTSAGRGAPRWVFAGTAAVGNALFTNATGIGATASRVRAANSGSWRRATWGSLVNPSDGKRRTKRGRDSAAAVAPRAAINHGGQQVSGLRGLASGGGFPWGRLSHAAGDPSFSPRLPPGTQPGEINGRGWGGRRKKPVSTTGPYNSFHCRRPPHPHAGWGGGGGGQVMRQLGSSGKPSHNRSARTQRT